MSKSGISGVLSIVSGSLGVLGFLSMILSAIILPALPGLSYYGLMSSEFDLISLLQITYTMLGIICLLLSILAVVGGVYSVKRKYWPLALTGAICGLLVFFPTGIPAIIFVAMGKEEFIKSSQEEPLLQ
jgi:hypothetical protein